MIFGSSKNLELPTYSEWKGFMYSIPNLFFSALFEEAAKFMGVKLAAGTKLQILSYIWLFFGESSLKIMALVEDLEFLPEERLAVYTGAAFVAVGSSIIHLYTSLYYRNSRCPIGSLITGTVGHTMFNYYANRFVVDPGYTGLAITAWVMSSAFGLALFIAFKLERKLLTT